uniref:Platelet glycoprotein 4 n=1 Tax=Sinocyclocheilus grahami TaxID=75366 RepID=A0A672RAY3_SINGR
MLKCNQQCCIIITSYPLSQIIFIILGDVMVPCLCCDQCELYFLLFQGVYSLLDHRLANLFIQSSGSTLFQKRTVKELLWGYKDPMLGSTLGVFYPYNDTIDGPYTVFTGKDDINKVATIERWAGEPSLSYWNDTYCNKINGTDGSSFHPFLNKKEPLYFFSSDICRSISAEYKGTVDLKGIDVYRYMLPPEALASPVENPDNQCYCTNPVLTRNCTTAGLLDLTACKGTPVFLSLPHFLYGSNDLHQGVIGLNPNFDEHSIALDVEPITGFTLRFAKRLQVNMLYGPSDNFVSYLLVGLVLFASCLIGSIVVCTKPSNSKLSLIVK